MGELTFGRRSTTRDLTTGGLLAALLAASAWIAIPVGSVPLTLQVLIVLLIGLVLPPARAFVAVGVYILLGAVGAPVFAGGQGGLGVIMGPTGGYLMGFLLAAPLVAVVRRAFPVRYSTWIADGAGVAVGLAMMYTLGWAQLALVTGMGPVAAFAVGVVPFVVPDIAKGVIAVAIAASLRRAGVVAH